MLAAMASGPWRAWIRPALSRAWWFLRTRKPPRRLRFTREGKLFVGLTVGVGVAAVNTGNNLLYLVLGLLLSLITLSGVLSEIALRGLEFRRRLPRRAYAGVAALVEIEVFNRKRYAPSYSIEVEDRIEGRRTDKRCYFLKVSAGARQTAAYRRVAPVRGAERYVSLRVATRFPFGLFEKWREVDMPEEQLVYPSPLRTGERAPQDTVNGEHFAREERGQGEVDGVRELREGDPLRDIHWPKTASAGRPIARERRREGARAVRVEVPNRVAPREGAANERARQVEEAIRRAAWQCLDALRGGARVNLIAQDPGPDGLGAVHLHPGAGSADRALSFLARLPPTPTPHDEARPAEVKSP